MPKINGQFITAYKNSIELSDGLTLSISFTAWGNQGDPDADSSETEFFLEGELIDRQDLPTEVTAKVIKELELNATENRSYDFGGDDECY